MRRSSVCGVVLFLLAAPWCFAQVQIQGELKKWHKVTLTFDGPYCDERGTPNPFRDYRLMVVFRHGEKKYRVHGFFAADGNAANTGASSGNKWRVHFVPDEEGVWQFEVSFRHGPDVAISEDPQAGKPLPPDGLTGSFRVGPTDKGGRDFRAKGLLRYVGEHYLQFAETKEYFLKVGADSPENFLAYADFDGTSRIPAGKRPGEAVSRGLHTYSKHVKDWRPGDPTWKDGKGKGIIGALNYLASEGMNSVYFITMNVGGDGKDVWPWIDPNTHDRFDCSKLDQWEIVFSHMDRLGIMLHVVTQEQENDQLLNGGALGPERKLYYRELVARFAHHLALIWNLGEENTNTHEQRKQFARYFHELDPYDHPVVCHTFPKMIEAVYAPLLGYEWFEGLSLQTNEGHRWVDFWIRRSAQAGRKWVVCLDEIGPAKVGVKPDADDYWHDDIRRVHLWPVLLAGAAGVEWYFGYDYPHNDLTCEDWRSRDHWWDMNRYAAEFFHKYLPFWKMRHADQLVEGKQAHCFALPGQIYAVYLPFGGSAQLDLEQFAGQFRIHWYNPRTGGDLQAGSVQTIRGPGKKSLGNPPAEPTKDWVVLIRAEK